MTTASQVYDCVKLLLRNEVFHPSAVSGVNVAATRPVSFFTLRDISACTTTRKCQCVLSKRQSLRTISIDTTRLTCNAIRF